MRGKVTVAAFDKLGDRITPAYAGKSPTNSMKNEKNRDHPRLCGEKSDGLTVYLHVSGSPPPMRGKVPLLPQVHE